MSVIICNEEMTEQSGISDVEINSVLKWLEN